MRLNRTEQVVISVAVFKKLLDIPYIKDYRKYTLTLESLKISFADLQKLARKANVPYPLFFAPEEIVDFQLQYKNRNISNKIQAKEIIQLNSRGNTVINDVELLVKDIAKKQEFLKKRIFKKHPDNQFVGLSNSFKNRPTEEVAEYIRNYFGFNLNILRDASKGKVLEYLTVCIERKGIFVSFSSYNYMPQHIDPSVEISGLCIKDKKFPFIFINTRDGDENPKVIESDGRQIFTLLAMLSSIAINKFFLSSEGGRDDKENKHVYKIASEIIVPRRDLNNISIITIDDLKEKSHFFKVTPSMLLFALQNAGLISRDNANSFREILKLELTKSTLTRRNPPTPVTGYSKYNGRRFSKEVIMAYSSSIISAVDVKNILFRSNNIETKIFDNYIKRYSR